eukprot:TRINITY_DN71252_c0_g1_i1.p1 TRINITY_DN71252_c0_g1~~TRINITY_DN71252_c0_g1_i1.p1  ORF type:complete len:429 (+),score=121.68 TRINITY_DN71252_c0_g1_i1:80-1288(+)
MQQEPAGSTEDDVVREVEDEVKRAERHLRGEQYYEVTVKQLLLFLLFAGCCAAVGYGAAARSASCSGAVCLQYERSPLREVFHLLSPLRVWVPGVVDLVYVWDPSQVAELMDDPYLARMASYPPEQLPGANFRRFWDQTVWRDAEGRWWSGFADVPNDTRVEQLRHALTPVTPGEAEEVASALLATDRPRAAHAIAALLAARVLQGEVSAADAALGCDLFSSYEQSRAPGALQRAREAKRRVTAHPAVRGDSDLFHALASACHSLFTAAERGYLGRFAADGREALLADSPLHTLPRWTPEPSTLGNRLFFPTSEYTVVLLKAGYAARVSGDDRLLFGFSRECPARAFVLSLADEVHRVISQRRMETVAAQELLRRPEEEELGEQPQEDTGSDDTAPAEGAND